MLHLKDLMQREVVAVSPDLTLRELVEVLTEQDVSGAPVVSGGKVVGVISTTDIFDLHEEISGLSPAGGDEQDEAEPAPRRSGGGRDFFSDTWEPGEVGAEEWARIASRRDWDILDAYTVADVMTRDVVSQPSKTNVKKAARYMLEAGVHRVLVIDRGHLQGIVTTTDILRAVAEGKLKG
jgi:predicted transcriptional regulator